MSHTSLKPKELIKKGSDWFFLSRGGWINRLTPLVYGLTTIYAVFLLAALIGIVNAKAESFVVLIGFTNLLQWFALPVLKMSRLESPTYCLIYLVINGLSIIGYLIILVLTILMVIDFKSNCPMEHMIIAGYGVSILVLQILVFLEYRYLVKLNYPLSSNQGIVPIPK